MQSADSSAAPAEGHLLWHWAYFRPCNYGPTISQVLRHHTDVTRSHKMGDGGSMSYNSSRMCQFPPTPVHTVTLRHCSKSLLVTSSQNNKMDKSKNKTFSFIVSLVGRNIIFPAHSFRILHPINRLAIKRLLTLFYFGSDKGAEALQHSSQEKQRLAMKCLVFCCWLQINGNYVNSWRDFYSLEEAWCAEESQ